MLKLGCMSATTTNVIKTSIAVVISTHADTMSLATMLKRGTARTVISMRPTISTPTKVKVMATRQRRSRLENGCLSLK